MSFWRSRVWESPGPPSGAVAHWKDSELVGAAVVIVVVTYCSEQMGLKPAKGMGHTGEFHVELWLHHWSLRWGDFC